MYLQPHPNAIPFLIATLISAGFAVTIWPRRAALGAIALLIHMLGLVIWSGATAAMWLSTSLHTQLFWLEFSVLGIALTPLTFFIFSLQISHNERLLTKPLILFLAIEPLIGLLLLWTNNYHHLIHGPAQLWVRNGLAELIWSPSLWFHVDTVYMYLVIIAGVWFLVRSMTHSGELHRGQIKTILAGACIPLVMDLIYLSPLSKHLSNLELSPLFFAISGGFYYYAITRQKFMDLIPVAHSALIQSMTDSVVVLDLQDRIVEMNPAAGQFLGVTPDDVIGRRAREVLLGWRELTQPFWSQPEVRTEIVISQDIPRYIDLNVTPMVDAKKRTTGRILVFHDITSRKQNESILKETNKKLHEQLEEIRVLRDQLREQAIRDPLTNLFNRRYLEEMLTQELARASRENYPVCVIMMDIDRFKRVNDTCGHRVGDDVLQTLATLIILHIRGFDAACRYGGEEFVIVMPKLSIETACERAEFLRKEFANMNLPCANMKSSPTLSIGLASYPFDGTSGEQLLDVADQALYVAKNSGRNRVVVYSAMIEKKESLEGKTSK